MTKKNLYLDTATGDLVIENFNLKLTTNKSEWLSQSIENEFKTFYQEWFANQTIGIMYYEKILGKNVDNDEVNSIYLNRLKAREDIEEVIEFNIEYDNSIRKYYISFIVIMKLDDGETETVQSQFSV